MKESKIAIFLRWVIYLSAFMPLIIFNQYISPFHFGKVIIFRSVVEFMTLFFVVLVIKDRSYFPKPTKVFWAVTAFVAAYGITTFTSVSFYQSFWGTLERMGGWYSMLHFWVFFVILTGVMRERKHWMILLRFSFIAALLSACYGFLQKTSWDWILGSGGRNKIFGTIGNPALFAGYMIVSSFLATTLAFNPAEPRSWRKFYTLTAVLGFLAILMTGVRGSVIAMIFGVVVFGFLYSIRLGSKKVKNLTIVILLVVILLAGILYAFKNSSFIKSNQYLARYSDISITSTTVQTRFWAWQAGFKGFTDSVRSFVVGYGPENFNIPFSKHFNPKFYNGPGSETLFDRAHNQFLEVLFTMGIIGFIAYISIFFFLFKLLIGLKEQQNSDKHLNVLKIGLITTLIAYVIHNSFIFDTSANYLIFFFTIAFINFLGIANKTESTEEIHKKSVVLKQKNGLAYTVGFIFAIPVFLLIYFTNIIPARANYASTRGIILGWNNQTDAAVKKFQEALSYESFGKYEIRHRFAQYLLEANSTNLDDKAKGYLLSSADELKKNIIEFPQDYLPYLYLSRTYVTLGKSDPASPYNTMALDNSKKALEISPTFVRTYYEIAQAYLNKKDYSNAIETFKKAIDLNPKVGQSWWYLGVTQLEAGDVAAGADGIKTAIANGYNVNNEKDLLKISSLFIQTKDIISAIDVFEKLIVIAPNNAQYHASLAAAYVQVKKIDQAVEQAKIAASIDPKFEPEARAFVQNLGRQW